jgi:hypothetical protein
MMRLAYTITRLKVTVDVTLTAVTLLGSWSALALCGGTCDIHEIAWQAWFMMGAFPVMTVLDISRLRALRTKPTTTTAYSLASLALSGTLLVMAGLGRTSSGNEPLIARIGLVLILGVFVVLDVLSLERALRERSRSASAT